MKKRFLNLINRIRFAKLEKTTKQRTELRRQYVFADGRNERVIFWIERLARTYPDTYRLGKKVNHKEAMLQLYYSYDIPGVNYYINRMKRILKKNIKSS